MQSYKDAQGIVRFARKQTDGAAYSTFHFYLFVPVRPTNLYLFICFAPVIKRQSHTTGVCAEPAIGVAQGFKFEL